MKKITIINGPNLNLLGSREPGIYGHESFEVFLKTLKQEFPEFEIVCFQSNMEGEIINKIQEAGILSFGIIINAGGYTHTSVAISDALRSIAVPAVEVHLSNVYSREDYRHKSLLSPHVKGIISGFGLGSYRLAMAYFRKPV